MNRTTTHRPILGGSLYGEQANAVPIGVANTKYDIGVTYGSTIQEVDPDAFPWVINLLTPSVFVLT